MPVAGVLERTEMDPGALVLELTEGVFIDDSSRARAALADLQGLGVRLALDDFGTGYCSLSYLRRSPVNAIKIDRSFVADMGQDPTGGAIVAAVTDLGHTLGVSVTAEGVETQQQHDALLAIGCEFAQGFLYSRPLTASDVRGLLRSAGDGRAHRQGVGPLVRGERPSGS